MLYQFDKNMLINGKNIDGLNLMEGLVNYDLILLDPPCRKEREEPAKTQWMEDIKERMEKAHSFLKEDGAIAIHINENDYASLRMIMDEVFEENNYVNTFIVKMDNEIQGNQISPATTLDNVSHLLVVYRRSEQFYYKNPYKESTNKCNEGYCDSFISIADGNENAVKQDCELDMLNNLGMTKQIISIFTNKDSTILDFYAESGVTAHAIMELNMEDEGKRQFTLITNEGNQNYPTICKARIDEVAKKYNEHYKYFILEEEYDVQQGKIISDWANIQTPVEVLHVIKKELNIK